MTETQLKEGLSYAETVYHAANAFSKLDRELIKQHFDLRNKDVLDFGCGMGHMSVWMAQELGARVDGVDIDENHIAVAQAFRKKFPQANVQFGLANIIAQPVDKAYDFIFLNDVIEHIKPEWIPHVLDILIGKNLKTGGVIFFSYPPWEGPHASHLQPVSKIPWLQYFPQKWVVKYVKKRNHQLVGKNDILTEYLELNHMNHTKLTWYLRKYNLQPAFRKSHTKLNNFSFLKNTNLNFFPFKFIVTKELIAFRKST